MKLTLIILGVLVAAGALVTAMHIDEKPVAYAINTINDVGENITQRGTFNQDKYDSPIAKSVILYGKLYVDLMFLWLKEAVLWLYERPALAGLFIEKWFISSIVGMMVVVPTTPLMVRTSAFIYGGVTYVRDWRREREVR